MLIKLHCNHSKYCFTSLFPLPVFEPLISGTVVYSSFYSQHAVQWHIVASCCCSVAWSCPTLCDHVGCSMPGLPVLHYLLEFAQTHVHWVTDAIQPSHPLSSPSLPALHLFQHQGLFQWVSCSYQVARVLEFQLQHQSFQWIFRTDSFRIDWLGSQPYIYVYPFSPKFPSHSSCHITLSRVSCAIGAEFWIIWW